MRRRALVASLVAVALLTLVAGVFAWRVLSALGDSQGSAIVALPTPSDSVVSAGAARTPSPTASATSGARSTSTPANITAVGGSPGAATPVDVSPTAAALASTAASTPEGHTSVATPATAGTPVVTATPDPNETQLLTGEELSNLEIARKLLAASMGGGDPGRSSVWQGKTFINVLVLGVDRRPDGGDENSDVIIVARVDLVAKTVSGVSLPRDLLVDVPEIYSGKINGAYDAGVKASPDDQAAGVVKLRDTIQVLYGIKVDGYVLIDFNGFEEVIDAVGGVDVVVPEPIVDEEYPTEDYGIETVTFDKGLQHMDGQRALKYVRTRHQDDDDARRERQMDVLLALFDQGRDLGSIRKSDEIIVALSDTIQTSFDLEQQLTLARIGWEMDRADITLTTLEAPLIYGDTDPATGAWVYFSDPVEVAAFIDNHLRNGPTAGS